MPRIARFVRSDVPTIYHVISRTALDGFPLQDTEKDYLLQLIRHFGKFYFADVLGFCIMSNHFHLVVRMHPKDHLSDDAMKKRLEAWFPKEHGDRLLIQRIRSAYPILHLRFPHQVNVSPVLLLRPASCALRTFA